jgi:DNA polymerase III delta prime subunit
MTSIILSQTQLPQILKTMIETPESRSHMLFLGPPGSGKTTAAQSFAVALHGKTLNKFASLLFLNSSDERSLEIIRQKIYPFVESRMQSLFFDAGKAPPKVIIFDEAETLTDQAQCALRTLLQRSTKDVIIIFICNSLSHIHPQILNKFVIVPFAPTNSKRLQDILHTEIPRLDSLYRRGDIRFFKQCPTQNKSITRFLFKALHASSSKDLYSLISEPGTPFRERITWFLLFNQSIHPLATKEIALWSALTASETQSYLDEESLSQILYKLWSARMVDFLKE